MHDPLQPHAHEPNPAPPSASPTFTLTLPDKRKWFLGPRVLFTLTETAVTNCFIVSTGHGTSGPFTFRGVTLLDLIQKYWGQEFSQVEVVSADGFGNRIYAQELLQPDPAGPVLLAYALDDLSMTRAEGLVRMIVPNERDDALRQVKWIAQVNVLRVQS